MQATKSRINTYSRYNIIKVIKDELHKVGPEAIEKFKECCFGSYLDVRDNCSNVNAAIHALLTHEIVSDQEHENEIWFQVGSKMCIIIATKTNIFTTTHKIATKTYVYATKNHKITTKIHINATKKVKICHENPMLP